MPKSYTLVVTRPFSCDGREYTPGEIIGSVASEVPWGTLLSVTGAADRVAAMDDSEVDDEPTDEPSIEPESDIEPIAEADDDDTTEPQSPSTPASDEAGSDLLAMGLTPKIVESLAAAGITNAEQLLDFVAAEGDLLDLDGIKARDKKAILNALKV
jgi:predicted flap endonuclease-1-like 5' DNA nuclease